MQPFIWDQDLGRHVAISAYLEQREALLKVTESTLEYWKNRALADILTEEEYHLHVDARKAFNQLKAAYPPTPKLLDHDHVAQLLGIDEPTS